MTFEAFPLFPGVPGGMELAVILLIAILLFGANKIPKLARSTGEAMGEFKKGRETVEQELEEMRGTATMEDSEIEGPPSSDESPGPASSEPAEDTTTAAETGADASGSEAAERESEAETEER